VEILILGSAGWQPAVVDSLPTTQSMAATRTVRRFFGKLPKRTG